METSEQAAPDWLKVSPDQEELREAAAGLGLHHVLQGQ